MLAEYFIFKCCVCKTVLLLFKLTGKSIWLFRINFCNIAHASSDAYAMGGTWPPGLCHAFLMYIYVYYICTTIFMTCRTFLTWSIKKTITRTMVPITRRASSQFSYPDCPPFIFYNIPWSQGGMDLLEMMLKGGTIRGHVQLFLTCAWQRCMLQIFQ